MNVLMRFVNKVAMNLVRQDHHVVLHAQLADARKLFGRIDPSRRIVRVRHQENLRPGELTIEVVEVDPETAVGTLRQRIVDDHPVVEPRLPRERMVDRRLDHHPVALLRESAQRENDSGDHTRSEVDPLLFHFPTAVTPPPSRSPTGNNRPNERYIRKSDARPGGRSLR